MGRFSRGGSFIPEERACFLPLDFAVLADGKSVGGVEFVPGMDVERFGAEIGFWLSSRCRGAAGRGVDVRKYPGNSYLCRGLCHQFRIAAGVGENRVPACRDVPQGFFQERGVRGRLLLRIIERRK